MSRVASTSATTTTTDADAGIRIVVAPAQSAYFAGEPLTVSITFTNIRSVVSGKPKSTHKRAAHSISSAPLSKPPTSPGPPRTPTVPSSSSAFTRPAFNRQNSLPSRKGHIGKVNGHGAQGLLEQKREQLLNGKRPLSITIGEAEAAEIRSASYMQTKFAAEQTYCE